MKRFIPVVLLALGLLTACSGPTFVLAGKGSLIVSVTSPLGATADSSRALVGLAKENLSMTLSGEGVETKTFVMEPSSENGVYSAAVEAPFAQGLTISVTAKDTAGNIYAKGQTKVDIRSENQKVKLPLLPAITGTEIKTWNHYADLSSLPVGTVGIVQFTPPVAVATNFSATLTDAVLAVMRADGSLVARGAKSWSMTAGATVYLMYAKTAETGSFSVNLAGISNNKAGAFYTAYMESLARLFTGTRTEVGNTRSTTSTDGTVKSTGTVDAAGLETGSFTFIKAVNLSTGFQVDGTVSAIDQTIDGKSVKLIKGPLTITDAQGVTHAIQLDYYGSAADLYDFFFGLKAGSFVIDGVSFDVVGLADSVKGTIKAVTYVAPMTQAQVSVFVIAGAPTAYIPSITLNSPTGITANISGSTFSDVYVANTGNGTITKLSIPKSSGTGSASTSTSLFSAPRGLAFMPGSNVVAVAEPTRISTIDTSLTAGSISYKVGSTAGYADGIGAAALFNGLGGLKMDSAAANGYGADIANNKVRKVSTRDSTVTTLNGTFKNPEDVAVDMGGNVFVADTGNHRIWKIPADGGAPVPIAGATDNSPGFADGVGAAAKFSGPRGIAVDTVGNLYVADTGNNRIRTIKPDGTVATLAGTGATTFPSMSPATGATATFNAPVGIWVYFDGSSFVLWVTEQGNNLVRQIYKP